MREREWASPIPVSGDVMEGTGVRVICRDIGGASLISGDLDAGLAALAPDAPLLGLLGEMPQTGPAALRIGRDRAVLLWEEPRDDIHGWFGTYGVTPADYLTRRRVERAQDLLRATNLTVTEVCFAVGYSSLGSFSARFKALVGETPSAVQRRYAGSGAPRIPGCSPAPGLYRKGR